jgi:oligoribonuclease
MLAGNSVGFDRAAILAHDPHAFDRLHYHIIDFSVLNEVLGAWEPAALADAPTKDTDHRVSTCLRNSIERARWYRRLCRQSAAYRPHRAVSRNRDRQRLSS